MTAARYSASTVFNRAKAWQLVAAAHANCMGVALEDLQQQQLRGSADNKVDAAALAECKRRYDYAIGRLDAGGNIIRAADARKKAEARKTSSLATKTARQRYVPRAELVGHMEAWRQRLDMYTGAWYGQRVQELGEWLLLALHTYVPPLRRAMYMDLDVHDVVWDTDVNTWCIMVGHFFKTSKTASIDRVLLVESLVDPMAIYLRHRHVLNKGVGTAPAHAADANRALFVNKNRRRHSGTSMTGAFREFGGKQLGITAFGPHICRDIFATWYVMNHPHMGGHNVQVLAAQMATSVDMLDKHYLHLRGRANAIHMRAILDGRQDEEDDALDGGARHGVQQTMTAAQCKGILVAAAAAAGARRAVEELEVVARFRRPARGKKRKAQAAAHAREENQEIGAPNLPAANLPASTAAPSLVAFMRQCHVDGGGEQPRTVTAMDVVKYKFTYGVGAGASALNALVESGLVKHSTGKQLYSAQADALKKFKAFGYTAATGLAFMKQVRLGLG